MTMTAWFPSHSDTYGGSLAVAAAPADDSPLPTVAGPTSHGLAPVIHPEHPLFWFAAVAAAAVGFAYLSTTVRVGPIKAAASLGKG